MIDLRPPAGVRKAASRGIELVQAGRAGDGFEPATLDRAKRIAAGEQLTPRHVMRMHSFFSRHAVDRKPDWGTSGQETPGYVAWQAWGGDAGASWASRKSEEIKRARKNGELSEGEGHLMSLNDAPFHVILDQGEADQLSELLDDLTEAYGKWEDVEEDDDSEGPVDLSYLFGQARMRMSQIGDQMAADGEDPSEIDKIDQQLQAMHRNFLAKMKGDARAMQVAMSTYDQDHGAASDEPKEFEVDEAIMQPEVPDEMSYAEDIDAEEPGLWTPRQLDLYERIEGNVERFGKFNPGIGPDGMHYVGGENNPFKAGGMMCANCAFFEGGGICEIAAEAVEAEGVCKFWIVPESLVEEGE